MFRSLVLLPVLTPSLLLCCVCSHGASRLWTCVWPLLYPSHPQTRLVSLCFLCTLGMHDFTSTLSWKLTSSFSESYGECLRVCLYSTALGILKCMCACQHFRIELTTTTYDFTSASSSRWKLTSSYAESYGGCIDACQRLTSRGTFSALTDVSAFGLNSSPPPMTSPQLLARDEN